MIKYLLILISFLVLSACENKLSENAVSSVNGECPPDHSIKGNQSDTGDWIYHTERSRYYKITNAEECFANEQDAQKANYRKPKR